ncbi:hypothetical protein CRG98_026425 [Punica granatum]|uniref:Uncharacterized protein n=1 Tax=Punica granatum TaxID=22663 RepID=A0A2I0JAA8_PUNGR|nr:hypothetical protein CRG98_026425 [Punica granatum]
MARRAMTRGRPSRPPVPHDRRVVPTFAEAVHPGHPDRMTGELCQPSWVDHPQSSLLHSEMRCDQKPSPSWPPTPHDREPHRVIEFTSLCVTPRIYQRSSVPHTCPSMFAPTHTHMLNSKTANISESPLCSALRCSPVLTFAFASPALSYRARIYSIGLRPCIGLRPHFWASAPHRASTPLLGFDPASGSAPAFTFGFRPRIGLRPHFWASAPHQASAPLSGLGPAFTAFGLRPSIYCFQVSTHRIYCFQPHLKSKINLDSNSSKRYFEEQV